MKNRKNRIRENISSISERQFYKMNFFPSSSSSGNTKEQENGREIEIETGFIII
jgi:hypothetical protein